MAVQVTEDFETGLDNWSVVGNVFVDPTAAFIGANGLISDSTATNAACYIQRTGGVPAVAQRVFVGRIYLNVRNRPTTSQSIIQMGNANGAVKISLTTTGQLRGQAGTGTMVNSVALTTGQWYRIDWRADTSTGTATLDWQIDGSAQTQCQGTQAAADFTNIRIGLQSVQQGKIFMDELLLGNSSGDYPFGAPATIVAGIGTGTGASLSATTRVRASAGVATATFTTFVGTNNDLFVVGAPSIGSGTVHGGGPGLGNSDTAPALLATATGAVPNSPAKISVATGVAVASGAAFPAVGAKSTQAKAGWAVGRGGILVPVAADTFARGAQSGLGTSSSGLVYTVETNAFPGGGGEFKINASGQGEALLGVAAQMHGAALLGASSRDTRIVLRWQISKMPVTDLIEMFLWTRTSAVFADGYAGHMIIWPTTINGNFNRRNGVGTRTAILASTAIPGAPLMVPGEWWVMIFESINANPTELRMKIYREADGEPGSWTFETEDSAGTQTAGAPGFAFRMDTGTTDPPYTFAFDDLTVHNRGSLDATIAPGFSAFAEVATAVGAARTPAIGQVVSGTSLTVQMGIP